MTKVPVQAEELHLRRLEGPTGPTDRHRIHRTVSTDGTEIVGSVHGQGPPLVLVHGTAGDHTRWEPVRPVLLAEMERLMAQVRASRCSFCSLMHPRCWTWRSPESTRPICRWSP
jgi:hypothetical protein